MNTIMTDPASEPSGNSDLLLECMVALSDSWKRRSGKNWSKRPTGSRAFLLPQAVRPDGSLKVYVWRTPAASKPLWG